MTVGWHEVEPPVMAPLRPVERVRLVVRAAFAAVTLAVLFTAFLLVRLVELAAGALLGRRIEGVGDRVVQVWAVLALGTVGLRFRMSGAPMRGPGAFVANHSSWLDIVALQRAAAPHLVSKAEVRDWPGIGLIGRAIGTMFIDRRPGEAKRQEVELRARLARGERMAIFPEGTSTDGRRILPFKSALFAVFLAPELVGRVQVQPVTIRYRARPGLPEELYGWWGGMDFASHLRQVLARSTGGTVELTFHPPLAAEAFDGRKPLAQAAEAAVRRGFEAPEPV